MKYATFFAHLDVAAREACAAERISWEESVRDLMTRSKALGVDGMTMAYGEVTEKNLNLMRDQGLYAHMVYWDPGFVLGRSGDLIDRAAGMTADAGAEVLMVIPGCFPDRLTLEQSRENAYPLCRKLVEACEKRGVHCGMENFGGLPTSYSTVEGVRAYLDHVDGLGAVLDMGNALWQKQDVFEMWDMMKDRIVAVHAKDLTTRKVEGVVQNRTPAGHLLTPMPIGDGDLPMQELVSGILASGFDGGVTFEHDGYPDCMEFLRRSVACWNRLTGRKTAS